MGRALFTAIAVVLLAMPAAPQDTYFSFDSAPGTWVGQGFTDYSVAPSNGWSISAERNNDNGVTFDITRDAGPDPNMSNYFWRLDLAAPFNADLTPGFYDETARWPFQDTDQPGLTLSGNHRGNNRNGGFFEVLEAEYGPGGEVLRFAVNFTQYGEEQESRWITGQLRYNATVPEPGSAMLCALGGAALLRRRRR
ncbi:PEP-CTERM sorting domain-containing protein [Phycisphaeraceae bacterium D3-23]